ncbi:hypothetical protein SAMN05428969_3010 [Devosia sp. YR412]|nr:hypothetical protein SAMN05428969_3010 [Devosia sp. YR412]
MVQNRYTLCDGVGNPQDWSYTWQISDDVSLSSDCGFCGRNTLRFTYEVTHGPETRWICQHCVSRYPVGGEIDGDVMGPKAARAYAHGLTARLKQQTCSEVIRRVQAAVPDATLEEVVVYFDRNLQLSPLHAAKLFAAMVQAGEETNAGVFEIQTRSNAHQQEFGALPDSERTLVWIALSPQQRRRLASLGFAPEGTLVRRNSGRKPPRVEIQLAAPRIPVLSEVAAIDLTVKDDGNQ